MKKVGLHGKKETIIGALFVPEKGCVYFFAVHGAAMHVPESREDD